MGIRKKHIENLIEGVVFHSPSGKRFLVKSDKKAVVLDRPSAEQELADKFIDSGGKIELNKKVTNLTDRGIFLKNGQVYKNHNLIVGADGTNSIVRKCMNLPEPEKVVGIQYEISNFKIEDKNFIKVFVGDCFFPYHLWLISVNEDTVRIGMAFEGSINDGFKNLEKILELKFKGRFDKRHILRKMYGFITLNCVRLSYSSYGLLIGDAAGMIKPISGGGISLSLKSAEIASGVIEKVLKNESNLSAYEKIWFESFGKRIQDEYILLQRWKKLKTRDLENGFEKIKRKYGREFSLSSLILPKYSTLMTPLFLEILKQSTTVGNK